MIRVDIQSKNFGATPVLGSIRFDVSNGQTIALVGPSGIGKSTLLRIVSGIDSDFRGTVVRPEKQAVVFQEPTLLPWRSALENLCIIHPNLPKDRALDMLERVGLGGMAALFPGQLSLGQQRRLSLARAFVGAPEMLIMDEPFVSLDAQTGRAMLTLTKELIAETGPATLFVTHDIHEADVLADRVLKLQAGPQGAILAV
ncbi:NitT/TauT family transport system ATP-binding protein [Sulfitobacter marinus]|uniref:NitT/TauT family transport system ATP-binding protein n=1 Tax=Sulfitobacter marinus TaxID=394264 RepID=A0A1I6V6A4_9RHOB|nr:ABC transporter ATP-binding protein [Sulfitobacter marinus]SFT09253.1 NitT/TauT family transport system ATP-binding protein [Sulfitobacter marinus]